MAVEEHRVVVGVDYVGQGDVARFLADLQRLGLGVEQTQRRMQQALSNNQGALPITGPSTVPRAIEAGSLPGQGRVIRANEDALGRAQQDYIRALNDRSSVLRAQRFQERVASVADRPSAQSLTFGPGGNPQLQFGAAMTDATATLRTLRSRLASINDKIRAAEAQFNPSARTINAFATEHNRAAIEARTYAAASNSRTDGEGMYAEVLGNLVRSLQANTASGKQLLHQGIADYKLLASLAPEQREILVGSSEHPRDIGLRPGDGVPIPGTLGRNEAIAQLRDEQYGGLYRLQREVEQSLRGLAAAYGSRAIEARKSLALETATNQAVRRSKDLAQQQAVAMAAEVPAGLLRLYHASSEENLDSILRSGLHADRAGEVYLADTVRGAQTGRGGPSTPVYGVNVDPAKLTQGYGSDSTYLGSFGYYKHQGAIPAESIASVSKIGTLNNTSVLDHLQQTEIAAIRGRVVAEEQATAATLGVAAADKAFAAEVTYHAQEFSKPGDKYNVGQAYASHPTAGLLGSMTWGGFGENPGEIDNIGVLEKYRRMGIASGMLNAARSAGFDVQHSPARSIAGDAFARSVGGDLPPRRTIAENYEGYHDDVNQDIRHNLATLKSRLEADEQAEAVAIRGRVAAEEKATAAALGVSAADRALADSSNALHAQQALAASTGAPSGYAAQAGPEYERALASARARAAAETSTTGVAQRQPPLAITAGAQNLVNAEDEAARALRLQAAASKQAADAAEAMAGAGSGGGGRQPPPITAGGAAYEPDPEKHTQNTRRIKGESDWYAENERVIAAAQAEESSSLLRAKANVRAAEVALEQMVIRGDLPIGSKASKESGQTQAGYPTEPARLGAQATASKRLNAAYEGLTDAFRKEKEAEEKAAQAALRRAADVDTGVQHGPLRPLSEEALREADASFQQHGVVSPVVGAQRTYDDARANVRSAQADVNAIRSGSSQFLTNLEGQKALFAAETQLTAALNAEKVAAEQVTNAKKQAANEERLAAGGGAGGGGFGANFAAGFRGNPDTPIAKQLGQTARFSVFYGGMYKILFAITQTFQNALAEGIAFEDALTNLSIAAERPKDELVSLANKLGAESVRAGFAPSQGVQIGAQSLGLYGAAQPGTPLSTIDQVSAVSARVVSQLAVGSKKDPVELQGDIAAITQALGLGAKGLQRVADLDAFTTKRFGVAQGSTLSAVGQSASVGKAAGFSDEQLFAIAADMISRTGQTPTAVGGYMAQIFSRGGEGSLVDVAKKQGIDANQPLSQIIQQLSQLYKTAQPREQAQISAAFGRGKIQNAAVALLGDYGEVNQASTAARTDAQGSANKQFELHMANIGGQIREFSGELRLLAQQLGQAGLLDAIGAGILILKEFVGAANVVLGAFNLLPHAIRDVVVALGLYAAASKAGLVSNLGNQLVTRGLYAQGGAQLAEQGLRAPKQYWVPGVGGGANAATAAASAKLATAEAEATVATEAQSVAAAELAAAQAAAARTAASAAVGDAAVAASAEAVAAAQAALAEATGAAAAAEAQVAVAAEVLAAETAVAGAKQLGSSMATVAGGLLKMVGPLALLTGGIFALTSLISSSKKMVAAQEAAVGALAAGHDLDATTSSASDFRSQAAELTTQAEANKKATGWFANAITLGHADDSNDAMAARLKAEAKRLNAVADSTETAPLRTQTFNSYDPTDIKAGLDSIQGAGGTASTSLKALRDVLYGTAGAAKAAEKAFFPDEFAARATPGVQGSILDTFDQPNVRVTGAGLLDPKKFKTYSGGENVRGQDIAASIDQYLPDGEIEKRLQEGMKQLHVSKLADIGPEKARKLAEIVAAGTSKKIIDELGPGYADLGPVINAAIIDSITKDLLRQSKNARQTLDKHHKFTKEQGTAFADSLEAQHQGALAAIPTVDHTSKIKEDKSHLADLRKVGRKTEGGSTPHLLELIGAAEVSLVNEQLAGADAIRASAMANARTIAGVNAAGQAYLQTSIKALVKHGGADRVAEFLAGVGRRAKGMILQAIDDAIKFQNAIIAFEKGLRADADALNRIPGAGKARLGPDGDQVGQGPGAQAPTPKSEREKAAERRKKALEGERRAAEASVGVKPGDDPTRNAGRKEYNPNLDGKDGTKDDSTAAERRAAQLAAQATSGRSPVAAARAQIASARAALAKAKKGSVAYWDAVGQLNEGFNALSDAISAIGPAKASALAARSKDPRAAARAQILSGRAAVKAAEGDQAAYWAGMQTVYEGQNALAEASAAVPGARASAHAARVGGGIAEARAGMVAARAQMATAKGDQAAFYEGLASLYEAQRSFREALLTYRKNVMLLHSDMTNPLRQAQIETRAAAIKLRSDLGHGQSREVIAQDRVDLRTAQANAESTRFSQRLQDVQTADNLGRITHTAYIRYLDHEHDRLSAIRHRSYQQQQELDQVDGLLKDAAKQMQGQFNLGDIKLPTPYQVRRYIQQTAGGAVAKAGQVTSTSTTTLTMNVNGADTAKVTQIVQDVVGRTSRTTTSTSRRR